MRPDEAPARAPHARSSRRAFVLLPACAEPPRGIVLWHPYRGGEEAALKKVALRFEAERGVKVTVLAVPYEAYLAKLEAAIPRGNGPDVFVGPHNRLGEYLLHRIVAPVGDAFPDGDASLYEPVTVAAVTHEGARYAVPLASKCVALYYNPRLLPEPPRTLDDLASKKGALGAGVWPLAYESQSAYYHSALLHAYGGKLFDDADARRSEARRTGRRLRDDGRGRGAIAREGARARHDARRPGRGERQSRQDALHHGQGRGRDLRPMARGRSEGRRPVRGRPAACDLGRRSDAAVPHRRRRLHDARGREDRRRACVRARARERRVRS